MVTRRARQRRRRWGGITWRRALAGLVAAGIALAAVVLAGLVGTPSAARAAATGCSDTRKCVILVEVNGLEPKDVTRANTPFLWALAHSGDQANDPEYSSYPGLGNRNGWAWQAARGVMSTGDGPSTAALLTGDTAEQSAIPADVFAVPQPGATGASLQYYATGGSVHDATCGPTDPCDPAARNQLNGSTVLSQAQQNGKNVGVWLGDPAVCTIANNGLTAGTGLLYDKTPGQPSSSPLEDISSPPGGGSPAGACRDLWAPGTARPSSYTGQDPYCPSPADWPIVNNDPTYPAACPVADGEVLAAAANDMTSSSGLPDLSFLYLADIGLVKQRSGDGDCFAELGCGTSSSGVNASSTPPQAEPPAVSHALQSTDAALAGLVADLSANTNTSQSWQNTYLMVVGSHGYEATPTPLRVPDPNAVVPQSSSSAPSASSACSSNLNQNQHGTGDLACYVAEQSGTNPATSKPNAVLVPQGTMATIYYTGPNDPQFEEKTLHDLYVGLCGQPQAGSTKCDHGSDVNKGCQTLFAGASLPSNPAATPNCIQNVYYVDPSVIPSSGAQFSYGANQFVFGTPGDPGYPTSSNPSYNPNPDCQNATLANGDSNPFYDAGNCDPNLSSFYTQQRRGSWHLNVLNPTTTTDPSTQKSTTVYNPTGASGQMVVALEPGWAAGPLVGVSTNSSNSIGSNGTSTGVAATGTATDPIDPYLASSGGPRDRAIAAIINGPSTGSEPVVQYDDSPPGSSGDGLAPVTSYDPSKVQPSGSSPYVCDKNFLSSHATYQDSPSSDSFAVDRANADPGNDSAAFGSPVFKPQADSYAPTGFECQAQIIDFAQTIEALQSVPASSGAGQQTDGRFLDEAFARCLEPDNVTQPSGPICGSTPSLGNTNPPPTPVVAPLIIPPAIHIYIPPPPPKPYDFHGLIRNVQAQVVDQRNNTVPFAPPGAYLSSIRITADFGKPHSEVTITLYRNAPRVTGAKRAGDARARTRLTAIVRFCPFTVDRAPNVQLRFQVPTAYQPDHVGLAVRQVRMLSSATGPGCGQAKHNAFVAFGGLKGAIVPILDAGLLHKLKPCPASLSVVLPNGPGVSGRSVTILRGFRVVRVIPGSQLTGTLLVIPARQLPGGPLEVLVQWLKQGQRRLLNFSYTSQFYNCSAAQRRRLGAH